MVYDAQGKRLFALNAAAAFVWLSFSEGASRDETGWELAVAFGLGDDQVKQWLDLALTSFEQVGFHESAADELHFDGRPQSTVIPPADAAGINYGLLGRTVRIDAPDEVRDMLDSMLGGMRRSTASGDGTRPDLALEIRPAKGGYQLFNSGELLATADRRRLTSEVEQAIFQNILPQASHFLAFHAAFLKRHRKTLLFPAPSGSGKTTLSAVLAREGWSYGSDEMALLDRDLMFRGLPFPPCIKAENYPLIEAWHPALRDAPEHDRFGRRVKFLPLEAEEFREPVTTVVFPRYDPAAATELDPVEPLAGLARLLTLCVYVPPSFEEADVARLLEWHGRASYFTLSFHDPVEAVALLGELTAPGLAEKT